MKAISVVLICNRRTVDDKYWVKCYTQEDIEKTVREFSKDSYTEVIML